MIRIQLAYQGVDGTRQELVLAKHDASNTIEGCIRELDGSARTSVTILREGRRMIIGGGCNGRFVVRASLDGATSFDAVDPDQPDTASGLLEIVADGVRGYYEPFYVLPLALVMRAVTEFTTSGELTNSLVWEAP